MKFVQEYSINWKTCFSKLSVENRLFLKDCKLGLCEKSRFSFLLVTHWVDDREFYTRSILITINEINLECTYTLLFYHKTSRYSTEILYLQLLLFLRLLLNRRCIGITNLIDKYNWSSDLSESNVICSLFFFNFLKL